MSKRIAYVCMDGGVPVFGSKGASVHVQEVVRAFGRRGSAVELFAVRFDGSPPPSLRDIVCHAIAPASAGTAALNAALEEALTPAGPWDLIYERYSLRSYAAMESAERLGIPGLLEMNSPLIDEQARHRRLADRDDAERCTRRACAAASAIVAVSREVADYAGRFTERGKVHVVLNGVDPARCSPDVLPSLPAPPSVLTLGFSGSMKPWHGVDVLLDAFAIVHAAAPQTRLLVVGDGPERAAAQRTVQERCLSQCAIFTGAVSPDAVPGLLRSMDVAVAPYPDAAGFYFSPLKVFEYMAAGLAIVASRIGQVREIIRDDETGVLCPPGDASALAAEVLRLFEDPERRARLARAARRAACDTHTWDAVVSRLFEIAAHSASRYVAANSAASGIPRKPGNGFTSTTTGPAGP
jgi:glycosyltransferase involved in cell wall biosynthesis